MSMKPLAAILPDVLRDLRLDEAAAGWRAVAEWPALAGERIAKRTRAVAFRDGVMTIEVEGSAWMHELGFLRRELVRRANQRAGANVVRDVRFVPVRGGIQR
jgi:predicted nucleic acid-binding Zn ribbon protein